MPSNVLGPSTINHQPSTNLPFTPALNESEKAFQAFLQYFDLGQNRSYVIVARKTGIALSTIKSWAQNFQWRERIRACNTHLLQSRMTVEAQAAVNHGELSAQRNATLKEREWAATEKLVQFAERMLASLDERDPSEVPFWEVTKALELASKLGRLATALPADQAEEPTEALGPVQLEMQAALEKAYSPPSQQQPEQLTTNN